MKPSLFARRARKDLLDIWLYIAPDNVTAADRMLEKIEQQCFRLAQHPQLGERRNDLANGLRVSCFHKYVICYRPTRLGIEIIRILHGARDWEREFEGESPEV